MSYNEEMPNTLYPRYLTVYILLLVAVAFASSLRGLPLWYQLLVAVTPIVTVTSLWLTNQIDPGIVPPSPNGEKDAIVELLDEGHTDITDYEKYGKDAKGRWTRAVLTEDGYKDHEKYCVICNVWRPRRGYHCDSCGHCMDRGDHHCDVMGTCVAKTNHRFFAAFLCFAQLGCGLMMGGSIWRLGRIGFPNGPRIWDNPETIILLVLAVFYGYHVLMLVFGNFHLVGIIFDFTTKDTASDDVEGDCRRNAPCFPGRRNPRALCRTWGEVCCGPVVLFRSTFSSLSQSPGGRDSGLVAGEVEISGMNVNSTRDVLRGKDSSSLALPRATF